MIWNRIKYWVLAVGALIMVVLGFLHGPKPKGSVLKAQVKAHNAKGDLLNAEISVSEKKAEASATQGEKKRFIEKADTLKLRRVDLEKERLRLLEQTGDIDEDAALAASDNHSRRSSVG